MFSRNPGCLCVVFSVCFCFFSLPAQPPHCLVDPSMVLGTGTKSGFLKKKSDHWGIWNDRWFALEESQLLYWNEQPQAEHERPRGILNLTGARVEGVRIEGGGSRHVVLLSLVHGDHPYALAAPTAALAEEWRASLVTAAVRLCSV